MKCDAIINDNKSLVDRVLRTRTHVFLFIFLIIIPIIISINMNIISLTVWTLEHNCFIVYTGMIVCFVAFTFYHKKKLEDSQLRRIERREKVKYIGARGL